MLPSLVKETTLSWHDSFVGKKRKQVWREKFIQRPKLSFIFLTLVGDKVVYRCPSFDSS